MRCRGMASSSNYVKLVWLIKLMYITFFASLSQFVCFQRRKKTLTKNSTYLGTDSSNTLWINQIPLDLQSYIIMIFPQMGSKYRTKDWWFHGRLGWIQVNACDTYMSSFDYRFHQHSAKHPGPCCSYCWIFCCTMITQSIMILCLVLAAQLSNET